MFAVMKGDRMVEPANTSREFMEQLAKAYGDGYEVRDVIVLENDDDE